MCKKFSEVVDNTAELQYIREADAAGLKIDTEQVAVATNIGDTLEKFRRVQKAYRTPRFASVKKLRLEPILAKDWFAYPLIVGDFAIIPGAASAPEKIGVLDLRASLPEGGQRFRKMDTDFDFDEVFVSLEQDLIFYVEEHKIHIREFSTGDIPDRVIAVHGDDMPILEGDIPNEVTGFDNISVWRNWVLVSVAQNDGPAHGHYLYDLTTGMQITVEPTTRSQIDPSLTPHSRSSTGTTLAVSWSTVMQSYLAKITFRLEGTLRLSLCGSTSSLLARSTPKVTFSSLDS